ncbi:MAG: carbohydrate kinase family protein [Clostridia bacterium]|nr:carbohydrate kinase family protein [Clostridia bacterium]
MKKVVILGGTTYDSIVHLKNLPEQKPQTIHYASFNETLGSTGAGKALNLAKLNVPTVLHSIIGNDIYGEKIVKSLTSNGVNFIYDIDANGTERHINIMDEEGNRISIFVTNSSDSPSLDLDRLESIIRDCDIIVLNIISYTKKLINLCKKYNKPIWTDLHDYDGKNSYHEDYINVSDYIFMSSDNMSDYKSVMKDLYSKGKKLIVCTHGKKGATCLAESGDWIQTDIIDKYRYKDANGAGDSFFSGFLYGYLQNKSIEECLRFATICAGLCITSEELAYKDLSEEILNKEYFDCYIKNR